MKGTFTWGKNLKPEYAWFNGTATHYLLGDKVTGAPVRINELRGRYADPEAKIIPVKVQRSRQPYDPVYKTLIQPLLAGAQDDDDDAYWKRFDWPRAARAGMQRVGLPFGGKVDFISTEMVWPINHMVAPKAQAVGCEECHTRHGSRLAALTDFYLPGRDRNRWVDAAGISIIVLTLLGVGAHAALRLLIALRRRERH